MITTLLRHVRCPSLFGVLSCLSSATCLPNHSNPTRLSSWPTLFEKTWQSEHLIAKTAADVGLLTALHYCSSMLFAQISRAFFGSVIILASDGHNELGPTAAQPNWRL